MVWTRFRNRMQQGSCIRAYMDVFTACCGNRVQAMPQKIRLLKIMFNIGNDVHLRFSETAEVKKVIFYIIMKIRKQSSINQFA